MKVMISQPMAGLSRQEIEETRSHVVAMLTSHGHQVVDSYVSEESPPTNNEALFCLGKSLQIMAMSDAVYFLPGWESARGCQMEHKACTEYGIKILQDATLNDNLRGQ